MSFLPLCNLAVSWALFGLIWTIQLVHYPTFRYVPDFTEFHPHHTGSITLIVMPLMLLELGLAFWLAWEAQWSWTYLVPLLMVLLIWGLTFFWAIPLHEGLAKVRDDLKIEELIRANWPRTFLWTAKGIWLLWLVSK